MSNTTTPSPDLRGHPCFDGVPDGELPVAVRSSPGSDAQANGLAALPESPLTHVPQETVTSRVDGGPHPPRRLASPSSLADSRPREAANPYQAIQQGHTSNVKASTRTEGIAGSLRANPPAGPTPYVTPPTGTRSSTTPSGGSRLSVSPPPRLHTRSIHPDVRADKIRDPYLPVSRVTSQSGASGSQIPLPARNGRLSTSVLHKQPSKDVAGEKSRSKQRVRTIAERPASRLSSRSDGVRSGANGPKSSISVTTGRHGRDANTSPDRADGTVKASAAVSVVHEKGSGETDAQKHRRSMKNMRRLRGMIRNGLRALCICGGQGEANVGVKVNESQKESPMRKASGRTKIPVPSGSQPQGSINSVNGHSVNGVDRRGKGKATAQAPRVLEMEHLLRAQRTEESANGIDRDSANSQDGNSVYGLNGEDRKGKGRPISQIPRLPEIHQLLQPQKTRGSEEGRNRDPVSGVDRKGKGKAISQDSEMQPLWRTPSRQESTEEGQTPCRENSGSSGGTSTSIRVINRHHLKIVHGVPVENARVPSSFGPQPISNSRRSSAIPTPKQISTPVSSYYPRGSRKSFSAYLQTHPAPAPTPRTSMSRRYSTIQDQSLLDHTGSVASRDSRTSRQSWNPWHLPSPPRDRFWEKGESLWSMLGLTNRDPTSHRRSRAESLMSRRAAAANSRLSAPPALRSMPSVTESDRVGDEDEFTDAGDAVPAMPTTGLWPPDVAAFLGVCDHNPPVSPKSPLRRSLRGSRRAGSSSLRMAAMTAAASERGANGVSRNTSMASSKPSSAGRTVTTQTTVMTYSGFDVRLKAGPRCERCGRRSSELVEEDEESLLPETGQTTPSGDCGEENDEEPASDETARDKGKGKATWGSPPDGLPEEGQSEATWGSPPHGHDEEEQSEATERPTPQDDNSEEETQGSPRDRPQSMSGAGYVTLIQNPSSASPSAVWDIHQGRWVRACRPASTPAPSGSALRARRLANGDEGPSSGRGPSMGEGFI